MKFAKIIREEVAPDVIEGLDGPDGVISYLEDIGADYREESVNGNSVLVVGKRQHVVEFEGKFPVVSELDRFLMEKSSTRHFSEFTGIDWREYYTDQFWNEAGTIFDKLYHATEEQYVESILEDGIKATNKTRIPTSKIRQPAVFAVKRMSLLQGGAYGGEIFAIDAAQMASDGYTPQVGREKDWERQDRANFLKDKLNLYGEIRTIVPAGEGGSGSWRDTVVIYGDVPAKYITLT